MHTYIYTGISYTRILYDTRYIPGGIIYDHTWLTYNMFSFFVPLFIPVILQATVRFCQAAAFRSRHDQEGAR